MANAPTPSIPDYLNASQSVYDQNGAASFTPLGGLTQVLEDGQPLVSPQRQLSDGFYASVYQNANGNWIVAFEGTVPKPWTSYGLGTIEADALLDGGLLPGRAAIPQALLDADAFMQTVLCYASASNIFVTGHSLGASEAEYVTSLEPGLGGGVGFGGTGIPNYAGVPSNHPTFTNYLNYGDTVANDSSDSPAGQTFGITNQNHVGNVQWIGDISDQQRFVIDHELITELLSINAPNYIVNIAGAKELSDLANGIQLHMLGVYKSILIPSSKSIFDDDFFDLNEAFSGIQNVSEVINSAGSTIESGILKTSTSDGIVATNIVDTEFADGDTELSTKTTSVNESVDEQTTYDDVGDPLTNTATVGGVSITVDANDDLGSSVTSDGAIVVTIDNYTNDASANVVLNTDGSLEIDLGDDNAVVQAIKFSASSLSGLSLGISVADNDDVIIKSQIKNGYEVEIGMQNNIIDVMQDFTFLGTSGALQIDEPASFQGTVFGFAIGDSLDLAGIGTATSAMLGADNILSVNKSSGESIAVNLSSSANYADDFFMVSPDGIGGTNVKIEKFSIAPIEPIINENAPSARFTITRSGDISASQTVYVSTTDGWSVPGENINSGDFTPLDDVPIIFAAGAATVNVNVGINDLNVDSGAIKLFGLNVTNGPLGSSQSIIRDEFSIDDNDKVSANNRNIAYHYTGNAFDQTTSGDDFMGGSITADINVYDVPEGVTGSYDYEGEKLGTISVWGVTVPVNIDYDETQQVGLIINNTNIEGWNLSGSTGLDPNDIQMTTYYDPNVGDLDWASTNGALVQGGNENPGMWAITSNMPYTPLGDSLNVTKLEAGTDIDLQAGAWSTLEGSDGSVNLTSAQTNIIGGSDKVNFGSGQGNVASLYETGGNWDSVYGSAGAVTLTNANASIFGGGDAISFSGSSGNAASLYGTEGNWDTVFGSFGAVDLIGAQASVFGGSNSVDFADGSGNAASLYDTANDWDGVSGSGGTIYLTSAQASVFGGSDSVDFVGGSGSAASLYDTANNWDGVNGLDGTVYLTSAQTNVSGGGKGVYFAGGSGNAASLYNTAGNWDAVGGSGGFVYLTSSQTSVFGSLDTIDFAGGSDNAVSLYATAGAWDTVNGQDGTVYLTSSQASVIGGGDAIDIAGGSGNAANLAGTDGDWDFVTGSNVMLGLYGAQTSVVGGSDAINFAGGSGNAVNLAGTDGDWDVVTGSSGTIGLYSAQVSIFGSLDTIDFAGGSGNAVSLYSTAGVWDTVKGSNGTVYLTSAQASVIGGGDTINLAGAGTIVSLGAMNGSGDAVNGSSATVDLYGVTAKVTGSNDTMKFYDGDALTLNGGSDTLTFQAGIGGQDTINGFVLSDSLNLSKSDFANFAALSSHLSQSGANAVITLNAADMIILAGVAASNLTSAQFAFA